jgi:hypothetical protein
MSWDKEGWAWRDGDNVVRISSTNGRVDILLCTPTNMSGSLFRNTSFNPPSVGFVLTKMNASPFLAEFTSPDGAVTGWGRGVVITVSGP